MKDKTKFNTPILFLVFKRLDTTKQVFSSIKRIKPTKLYLAADGPHQGNAEEAKQCLKVREYLKANIDWDCKIKFRENNENFSCRYGPSSAIDWFFQHEKEGIILEDDCLPADNFYYFCAEMLSRYREDTRISHIGGFNCQNGRKRGKYTYYFSRYFHCWGWATWQRAWHGYDVDMTDYNDFLAEKVLENIFCDRYIIAFWKEIFKETYLKRVNTWDYQWVYKNFKENQLAVVPNYNLIQNIGFGRGATHTVKEFFKVPRIADDIPSNWGQPPFVYLHQEADAYTYKTHLGINWLYKIKFNLKRLLRSFGLIR